MRICYQRLLCTTAFVAPLVCFGAAMAQAAAQTGSSPAQVDEIVVVARRVNESLQKVPESIGVVTPKALAEGNIQGLNDVRLAVANLYIQSSPVAGGNESAIRGVAGQSIPNATVFSSIGIYIDGVDIGRSTSAGGNIADLARVEVARGPQGTLFGRNASSGAINFITGEPTDDFGADLSVGLGNYDERRGTVTINTGRFGNGFAARLSYSHDEYGDDVKNVAPQKSWLFNESANNFKSLTGFGGRDADTVMGKLRYDALSGFSAEYKFDWSRQVDDISGGQLLGISAGSFGIGATLAATPTVQPKLFGFKRLGTVNSAFAGPASVESFGHLLTLTEPVGDNITLKSLTALRSDESFVDNNQDGVTYQGGLMGLGAISTQHQHQFSEELQLIGKWQKLSYLAGLYYFRENASYDLSNFFFGTAFPSPVVNIITPFDKSTGEREHAVATSMAAYGHLDYAFTDQWDFAAGVRYTVDKQIAHDSRLAVPKVTTTNFKRPNYDLTLTYSPDPDIHVYVRRATGYTAGGSVASKPFSPEDSESDEIGVKTDLFDRRLRVNAAYYYATYTNEQLVGFDLAAGGLVVTNVGRAKIDGAELEISARPIDSLTLTANFGFNNPQYKQPPSKSGATNRGNITPRTTINLTADYKAWTFDNGAFISIEGDGNYRSKYFAINATDPGDKLANPAAPLPPAVYAGYPSEQAYLNALYAAGVDGGYWLANARLSLQDIPIFGGGKLKASLYARNIANSAGEVYGVAPLAGIVANFERPRTYGIELAAHF